MIFFRESSALAMSRVNALFRPSLPAVTTTASPTNSALSLLKKYEVLPGVWPGVSTTSNPSSDSSDALLKLSTGSVFINPETILLASDLAGFIFSLPDMTSISASGTYERIGVLKIASSKRAAFGPVDETSLAGLAPFVSTVIGAAVELAKVTSELIGSHAGPAAATTEAAHLGGASEAARARSAFVANVVRPGVALHSKARDRIEQVLAGAGPEMVLQPIVSLASGEVVEAEALARFAGPPARGPDQWFAEAAVVGLARELELRAIERALGLLPALPGPLRLAVNAGPETFCSSELLDLLRVSTPGRVVVELTEHVGIEDYPRLHRACAALRELGTQVAIDDTGTGFASLSLVLEVAPEIIKLDRELTAGIDLDPVRRALAKALVAFGNETGAEVIAEGIETAAELEVLAGLGIAYGQGYFLGRPASLESLLTLLRRSDRCHAMRGHVMLGYPVHH